MDTAVRMPVTLEAYALRRALMRMELAAARDAEGALRWLGWNGEGPLWLRRSDVQLYLWYQLPTKYLASLEDKLATAEAFGRLLELLDVPYAKLCAAPETLALLERWERDDRGARRELGRLLDASGLEPPDTELLAWGSVMGLEEAQAREDVATALEEALEAGDLGLGAPGFARRRNAVVDAVLAADGRLDAIHAERLQRWRSRGPIRERVADTIARPAPDFGDVGGAVAPARWLIERGADGLALTQTGALSRALVREAVERWPGWWDTELFGAPNQEAEIVPLQELRHLLRRMRLLRRDGRRLVSTARARSMAPAALLHACTTAWLAGETFEAVIGELAAALLLAGDPVEIDVLARQIHPVIVDEGWRAGAEPPSVHEIGASINHVLAVAEPLGIVVGRGWTERRVTDVGRVALHVGLRARALGPQRTL